jgi:hypothetical protein
MQTINKLELQRVVGGESVDPTAGLKRAADQKRGKNSLDLFGYSETHRQGAGAEYRRRLNDNVSIFGRGTIGTKDNKPDNGIQGGIRFEW